MITAEQLIEKLDLKALTIEGGYYNETYRCEEYINKTDLPLRYKSSRRFSTAIYYLLTPDTFSHIHKLESDEVFHYYLGDPVEMLQLFPDGSGKIITLGSDILNGMSVQVLAPKGVWQGMRLAKGGKFALMGTTVAPGFEYDDYENGDRNTLTNNYPDFKDFIISITK